MWYCMIIKYHIYIYLNNHPHHHFCCSNPKCIVCPIRIIPALRPSGHAAHPAGYKPLRPGCHGFVSMIFANVSLKITSKIHGKYCVYHCIYMCWHVFAIEKKRPLAQSWPTWVGWHWSSPAMVSMKSFRTQLMAPYDAKMSVPLCCGKWHGLPLFFQQQVRKRTSLDNSSMTPKFVQRVRTGFQLSHGWRSDLLEHHTDLIRSCNVMYSVPCHPCLGHHRTWWITHTVYPLVIWHSHGKQIIYRWFTPITHGDFPQLC